MDHQYGPSSLCAKEKKDILPFEILMEEMKKKVLISE